MRKIEQLEEDLEEYLKEYINNYKQCLQEVLKHYNIEEKETVVYSNIYKIIGIITITQNDFYFQPYCLNFYPITLKGEISKNSRGYISSYNDFKGLDKDYYVTKLDINNKEELINAVKGLKKGSVKLEDLI